MTLHNEIRDKLMEAEGPSARKEVSNTNGRADLVTDNEIIEVTSILAIKDALGRLYAYSESKTFEGLNLKPRLHVYCKEDITFSYFEKHIQQAIGLCKNKVRLTFGNAGVFSLWTG